MPTIRLPNNWRPRPYQLGFWGYMEGGGRHAELIWHRRSGKDEVCLHWTACAAMERVATYWHMLPLATQARKAIWEAINPHTGRRRIDEAFPPEIRKRTNTQEMFIEFVNGSSWQVVGSDNYSARVGSPPAGIVYSEWALAHPAARAYLRPIIRENGGWQVFISTPRGHNHAKRTYEAALSDAGSFAERLSAYETGIFAPDDLEAERQAYIADFGEDMGIALFDQEYGCSFDAAILGAIYGAEIRKMEQAGRIGAVPADPSLPVHTVQDIGFTDDTTIIFWQSLAGEVRIVDAYANHGQGVEHYAEIMAEKARAGGWRYGQHWLPHDAQAKLFAAGGRSVLEQYKASGLAGDWRVLLNRQPEQQGIRAARKLFPRLWVDTSCGELLDALRNFRREWDDDRKCFRDTPVKDWTNHFADALRYLAWVWMEPGSQPKPEAPRTIVVGGKSTVTMNDLWRAAERDRRGRV